MTQRIPQVLPSLRQGLRYAVLGTLRTLLEVLDVTYMWLARCVDELSGHSFDANMQEAPPCELPKSNVIPLAEHRRHPRVQTLHSHSG